MRTLQLLTLALLATAARADSIQVSIEPGNMTAFTCCDQVGFLGTSAFQHIGLSAPQVGVECGDCFIVSTPDSSDSGFSLGPLISRNGNVSTYNGGVAAWHGVISNYRISGADCLAQGGLDNGLGTHNDDGACVFGFISPAQFTDIVTLNRSPDPYGDGGYLYTFSGNAQVTYRNILFSGFFTAAIEGPYDQSLGIPNPPPLAEPFTDAGIGIWSEEWSGASIPTSAPVPEPSTFLLLGAVVLTLKLKRKRA